MYSISYIAELILYWDVFNPWCVLPSRASSVFSALSSSIQTLARPGALGVVGWDLADLVCFLKGIWGCGSLVGDLDDCFFAGSYEKASKG